MKTLNIALIALSGLTASAALAATDPASTGEATSQAAASKPATNLRYCIVDKVTGSNIPRRTCKTSAEWALDGVDIEKFVK